MGGPESRDRETLRAEGSAPEATGADLGIKGLPEELGSTHTGEVDPGQAIEGLILVHNTSVTGVEAGDATHAGQADTPGTHRPGPTIAGYQIEGELGRGGMGVVYRARQVRLNRDVAVKMILAGRHAGAEAAARFLAEAEAIAQLQHPNIVQIFHIDEHDGFPYFEMEYVGGGSLAARLDGTPWPPREAARLVEALAGAMAEAHRRGVVHRDLKPANILLSPEGVPKVADFGLAKLLNVESGLTRTDSVLGSPSYMAPEQAEGKTKDVGPAADVYALGAILYELLVGRPPFRGATVLETLQQVKTAEPVPPSRLVPGLPRDVETIASKCLQKDPGKRYESATALAGDLRRFQAGEPIVARPVGSVERTWRWCRRNPALAGSLGATAAALVAVAVLATIFAVNQAEARKESNRRLQESRLRVAALDYERGQDACEKGEIGLGLLRLVQSWRSAVAAGNPGTDWQRIARTSLSAWQRHHPKLQAVFSHGAKVLCVAFSPDGKTVISGSYDGTARLWDVSTGRPIGQPLTHQGPVRAVAFSPDGTTLITGSDDNKVRLWDASTGRQLGQPLTHQGAVMAVAFSPDGKTILTGCGDGTARLWDASTGQPRGEAMTHKDAVRAVAFSPDGTTVISGSWDGTARLWDASTGQPRGEAMAHRGIVYAVAFSPDGTTVITGSYDGTARLWDASTGRPIGRPLTHQGIVFAVAFSPDGKTILTGCADRTARLWDASTGRPIGRPLTHQGQVSAVAYSPDGKTILTGCADRAARLWDASTGQPIGPTLTHEDEIYAVAFSPDGTTVISGSRDGTARLWDASTGRQLGQPPLMHPSEVWAVTFSPDGTTVITGCSDGKARFWDASTSQPIGPTLTHEALVWAVAFSSDGKTVLTGSLDRTARLWDASTGHHIGKPLQHQDQVKAVAFSPDGTTILTGCLDGTARLWDASTSLQLGQPLTHQDIVFAVAFSPDGTTVISGGADNTARLWDASTGRQLGQPLTHQAAVRAVAFSPDGTTVITGCLDGKARLWDVSTGRPIGRPLTHPDMVRAVAFSPDGTTVITGSRDGTARLWDVATELLPDDLDRVANWVEVLTGLALDENGSIQILDNAAWLRGREKVKQQGGPPVADAVR